jgi:hypothetical protein
MAGLRVNEFGINFYPIYFSHPRDGIHMCYLAKLDSISVNKGKILIQDESMRFIHLTYEVLSRFQQNMAWYFLPQRCGL